jgi:hypothetical protein
LWEWNLLPTGIRGTDVRVVTIKHPQQVLEGLPTDSFVIGQVHDVSPRLAILMMAAGWVRTETRTIMRRHRDLDPGLNRRQVGDRRSADPA